MSARLDAGPIIDWVAGRGGIGAVLGLQLPGRAREDDGPRRSDREVARWVRAYHRMLASGTVSLWQADVFCLRVLEVQAELLFGQAWWDVDKNDVA